MVEIIIFEKETKFTIRSLTSEIIFLYYKYIPKDYDKERCLKFLCHLHDLIVLQPMFNFNFFFRSTGTEWVFIHILVNKAVG